MARPAEEQNIKSRARRRLIGAIVFALAVVVILPMLLDSEPKITGTDIELRIPASDSAGEFVPGTSASNVVATAALENMDKASDVVPDAASGKITLAQSGPQVVADKNVAHLPAEEIKPEVKSPDVKKAEQAKAYLAEKPAQPKAVAAEKPDQPTAKATEKLAGSYIVQVGAFSNSAAAKQVSVKLKLLGVDAYTEVIDGTTRVRVGPFVERSKAEDVRKQLEQNGQHPVITTVK